MYVYTPATYKSTCDFNSSNGTVVFLHRGNAYFGQENTKEAILGAYDIGYLPEVKNFSVLFL